MEKKLVITISREYGSGGRRIGEAVAKKLGIAFYNRNIIDMVAQKSGLAKEYIHEWEEKISSRFVWPIIIPQGIRVYNERYYSNSDKMYHAQSTIIKELAQKENCVIVGRCANYILRGDENCYNVFIHAPIENRLKRVINDYGIKKEDALKYIKNTDKGRSNYCWNYTDIKWGGTKYYHLCIDSSKFEIDRAADIICSAVQAK